MLEQHIKSMAAHLVWMYRIPGAREHAEYRLAELERTWPTLREEMRKLWGKSGASTSPRTAMWLTAGSPRTPTRCSTFRRTTAAHLEAGNETRRQD